MFTTPSKESSLPRGLLAANLDQLSWVAALEVMAPPNLASLAPPRGSEANLCRSARSRQLLGGA